MTEKLDALDREWFGLTDKGAIGHWQYTRDPLACFGPGGPWEWLVQCAFPPSCGYIVIGGRAWAQAWEGFEARGDTIYEAITRCAVEARKKVEGES